MSIVNHFGSGQTEVDKQMANHFGSGQSGQVKRVLKSGRSGQVDKVKQETAQWLTAGDSGSKNRVEQHRQRHRPTAKGLNFSAYFFLGILGYRPGGRNFITLNRQGRKPQNAKPRDLSD
ncbi:MAG: hypothetical protein ABH867_01050 [Patescibacteria group bacterium]